MSSLDGRLTLELSAPCGFLGGMSYQLVGRLWCQYVVYVQQAMGIVRT